MYDNAKQRYATFGVDTEYALNKLKDIPVSIHCWQGDDVVGLDGGGRDTDDGKLHRTSKELRGA